jgi:hypothetical protein
VQLLLVTSVVADGAITVGEDHVAGRAFPVVMENAVLIELVAIAVLDRAATGVGLGRLTKEATTTTAWSIAWQGM